MIYPVTMPLAVANARFNFRTSYIRQFEVPGDSTMLPREFYRVPAHKHYNLWPELLGNVCDNPKELLAMYERVRKENWCDVRLHPQYLNNGWCADCVPPESKCRCCGDNSLQATQEFVVDDLALGISSSALAAAACAVGGLAAALVVYRATRVRHSAETHTDMEQLHQPGALAE